MRAFYVSRVDVLLHHSRNWLPIKILKSSETKIFEENLNLVLKIFKRINQIFISSFFFFVASKDLVSELENII